MIMLVGKEIQKALHTDSELFGILCRTGAVFPIIGLNREFLDNRIHAIKWKGKRYYVIFTPNDSSWNDSDMLTDIKTAIIARLL